MSESETTQTVKQEVAHSEISWPTFALSGGISLLFVATALTNLEFLSELVSTLFGWSTRYFGAYWQVFVLFNFLIGLAIALSRSGKARLGNRLEPEINGFKWFSIILCTLLAGGGVFFAAAEPMAHFISPPPLFGVSPASADAVYPALAQSFFHWGFLGWGLYGTSATIVLMYLHHNKGLPLKPRTLLYPIFGDKAITSWLGNVADAACAIAVVAGTVGPIGFLGLQVSYGLGEIFGTPDTLYSQFLIITFLIGLYTLSTVSGIHRGIQLLSTFNVALAFVLIAVMLILGPTSFILESFVKSVGVNITQLVPMALYRGDAAWLDSWTVFFWGWFMGYAPLMAIFVARISNGRTVRQIILGVSVAAPLVTAFWFTIVGGTGLAFEMSNPGSISEPFTGFNMPAALFAITQQLPAGFLISVLFLILTTIFVATTGDSMTYTISMVVSGREDPPAWLRIFWGIIMGLLAMILVSIGAGGISALQSFIVVTNVPVSIIMLPVLWFGPLFAWRLARLQGFVGR